MTAYDNSVRNRHGEHAFWVKDLDQTVPVGAGVSAYPSVIWDDNQSPAVPYTYDPVDGRFEDAAGNALVAVGPTLTSDSNVFAGLTGETTTTPTGPTFTGNGAISYAFGGGPDDALFDSGSLPNLVFSSAPDADSPGDANADNLYQVILDVTDSDGTRSYALNILVTAGGLSIPAIPMNDIVNAAYNPGVTHIVNGWSDGGVDFLATPALPSGNDVRIYEKTAGVWGSSLLTTPAIVSGLEAIGENIFAINGNNYRHYYRDGAGVWQGPNGSFSTVTCFAARGDGATLEVAVAQRRTTGVTQVRVYTHDGAGNWTNHFSQDVADTIRPSTIFWDEDNDGFVVWAVREGGTDQAPRSLWFEKPAGGWASHSGVHDAQYYAPIADNDYQSSNPNYLAVHGGGEYVVRKSINSTQVRVCKRQANPGDYRMIQQIGPSTGQTSMFIDPQVRIAGDFLYVSHESEKPYAAAGDQGIGYIDVFGFTGDVRAPFIHSHRIHPDPAGSGSFDPTSANTRNYTNSFAVTDSGDALVMLSNQDDGGATVVPALIYE